MAVARSYLKTAAGVELPPAHTSAALAKPPCALGIDGVACRSESHPVGVASNLGGNIAAFDISQDGSRRAFVRIAIAGTSGAADGEGVSPCKRDRFF
jgi:hypothetical protein